MHFPVPRLVAAAALLLTGCTPAMPEADAPREPAGSAVAHAHAAPDAVLPGPAGLRIEEAWIPSAPPGATVLAAYARVHNPGSTTLSLRPCPSAGFGAVELHRTSEEDGLARMRPLEALEVPAGASAVLAPGGDHLMLMRPAAEPAVGERIPVCLAAGGETRMVPFEVRTRAAAAGGHHHVH